MSVCFFPCRVNQDGVFQVKKVLRVNQDLLASRGRRVALDYLVFPDVRARLDLRALRELRVLPNTQHIDTHACKCLNNLSQSLVEHVGHHVASISSLCHLLTIVHA